MNPVRRLFCRCDLEAGPAVVAIALVAVALFAWADASWLVDRPDRDSVSNRLWQLWQLGALGIAGWGVWQLWFSTGRVPRVRGGALGIFALAIFANTYTDLFDNALFGDYDREVWMAINPLYIAGSSVAAAALWRRGGFAGRGGAVIAAVLGLADFANAYFINALVLWQILNPLMILAALAGAGAVCRPASARDG